MPEIAVVGAGMAGLNSARALRDAGFEGRIVLIGAERHAPYDRPPLSKGFLAGTLPFDGLSLAAPEDADFALDLRLGERAVALHPDRRAVELSTGERAGGAGAVIAAGARARTLPGPRMRGVHTLRTVDDAVALRDELGAGARLVVVGAGFLGAEVAATARALGVQVSMVEVAADPLSVALGGALGRLFGEIHADHGVRLLTGVAVTGFVDDGRSGAERRVRAVRLADGRVVEADLVVVAVGAEPDVRWLAGTGLDTGRGVLTDATGATGVPGVVATGDCTRRFEPLADAVVTQEHWTNALQHPQLAVAALLGTPPPPRQAHAAVPYVWSEQYGMRLQLAGHPKPGDDLEVVEGSLLSRSFVAVYRRGEVEVGVVALDSPRGFVRRRRALAAGLPG